MIDTKKIFILFFHFTFLISTSFSFSIPGTYSTDSLDERRKGVKILLSIWDSNKVTGDIESAIYISKLGQELISVISQQTKNYDFFLLDEDEINAFATWNGLIGINNGLVLFTENESELAAIIAHEISHVELEHLKRYQSKSENQQLITIGGVLASILVKDNEITEAILTSTIANDLQKHIDYTREHEIEADNYAIKIISKTNFNSNALSTFFRRMSDNSTAKDFLRTHPSNIERISNVFGRIKMHNSHYDNFEYEAMKIRIAIENNFPLELKNQSQNLYSNAYSLLKQGKLKEALKLADSLLEINSSFSSLILAGRIYAHNLQLSRSLSCFEQASHIRDDEIIKFYRAKSFFLNEKYNQAESYLKKFLKTNKSSIYTQKLMAEIYLKLGRMDRYHFHYGEMELLKVSFKKAIKHLNYAKKITSDKDFSDLIDHNISNIENQKKLLTDY